ncbi:MAG: hypothetical protein GC145_18625 [Caulobacter sp.]|nr:hypothetical protein [Caulobacter sp.]
MTSQIVAELPFYRQDGSFLGYAGYAAGLVLNLTQAQESGPEIPQDLDGRLFEQRVLTAEGEVLLTVTGVNRTLGRVAFNLTSEDTAALLPDESVAALDLIHVVAEVTSEGLTPLLSSEFSLRRVRPGLGAVVLKLEPTEGVVVVRYAGAPPLTMLQELIAAGDLAADATHADMIAFWQGEVAAYGAATLDSLAAQLATSLSAVGAAGDTEIGDIQIEGAAQVAAVGAAGTAQVQAIQDEGAAQIASVGGAGATQVQAVQDEGATQVAAVTAEGGVQVSAVEAEGGTQLTALDDRADLALATIAGAEAATTAPVVAAGAAALADIELARTEGLGDIATAAATAGDNVAAGMIPVYPTKAAGIAGVDDGVRFAVEQLYGRGVYHYRRNGAGADFLGVGLFGSEGQKIAAIRALRRLPSVVTPMPAEFTVNLWGVNAQEWDGRLLYNERAAALPTLNLLWNPFSFVDEEGNATPAAITSDPGIVDPDGGHNAMRLTSTADRQQYVFWRFLDDDLPTDDYRARARWLWISGATAWRIGGNNVGGSYTAFAATGAWTAQDSPVITGYDNVTKNFDINISSGSPNTDGVAAVYAVQFYDSLGGDTLPTTLAELAAMDGHGKRVTAYKGSIPFTSTYAIDHRTMIDGILVQLQAALVSYSEATLGIWMSATAVPATTYGSALSWKYRAVGSGSDHGLVGVTNTGLPYISPTLSVMVTKSAFNVIGQGFTSFFFTVKNGEMIPYLNGVPLYKDTGAWTTFDARALIIGAYNGTTKRSLTNKFVGYLDGAAFAPVAVSADKIAQADQHGRETLALCGSRAGLRKARAFGLCDSLTANAESPFWAMCLDTSITPHLHGDIDAVGGSDLAAWEARKTWLISQIIAADRAGYEEIWLFALAGANEWPRWRDDVAPGPYSYLPWKVDYLAYLASLKAVSSKVKIIGLPMIPRSGAGGLPYTTDSLQVERERNAWNADLVANHEAMGIDFVIDWRADEILQYATSAAAVPSSGSWVNPAYSVVLFLTAGTHFTTAGGAQLANLYLTPWAKARLALLSGVV